MKVKQMLRLGRRLIRWSSYNSTEKKLLLNTGFLERTFTRKLAGIFDLQKTS